MRCGFLFQIKHILSFQTFSLFLSFSIFACIFKLLSNNSNYKKVKHFKIMDSAQQSKLVNHQNQQPLVPNIELKVPQIQQNPSSFLNPQFSHMPKQQQSSSPRQDQKPNQSNQQINSAPPLLIQPQQQLNQIQILIQPQQSRPSPNQQSFSLQQQSNNTYQSKQSKSKDKQKQKLPPLSSQLTRLTKKSFSCKQSDRNGNNKPLIREKKVRYYITDFEPYLPSFLDELHRDHHKNLIRIGDKYQAYVPKQPEFEQLYKPMKHLRVWQGGLDNFSQQAYKKFKQLYGENRTQQQLILLKSRLQIDDWNILIKQMIEQKAMGKKTTLVINTQNSLGAVTRNK